MDYIFLLSEKYGQLDGHRISNPKWLEEPGHRMAESVVAVLGTGRIGSRIARMAREGFNCRVIAFDENRRHELENLGVHYVEFDKGGRSNAVKEAMSKANFIFIALPLNETTHSLIGPDQLLGMSAGVPRVLINVTRDKIVDAEPLYDFLGRGALVAYATDVLPNDVKLCKGGEPDDVIRKFIQHDGIVVTPHEGDCSKQSLERLCQEVLEKLSDIIR